MADLLDNEARQLGTIVIHKPFAFFFTRKAECLLQKKAYNNGAMSRVSRRLWSLPLCCATSRKVIRHNMVNWLGAGTLHFIKEH